MCVKGNSKHFKSIMIYVDPVDNSYWLFPYYPILPWGGMGCKALPFLKLKIEDTDMPTLFRKAIEWMEQHSKMVDEEYDNIAVMLLDIIMPVVDGFGVLEYMKEEGYIDKFPVVIVTDDSSEETSVKAFEYNVADMVIKPFEPRIIRRRVQNIIELYAYRNEELQH